MHRFLLALVTLLLVLARPAPVRAERPPSETWEDWRALGDGVIAVRATVSVPSNGARRAKVVLTRLDKNLAASGDSVAVYDGPAASTALGVRDGAAAVVLFRGGGQPFVKVALVDLGTHAVLSIESWVDARRHDRCFQLMETDAPTLFDTWVAAWSDIVKFEIVPVVGSAEAAAHAVW